MTATEELLRTCQALPPDKQLEVANFARFLLAGLEDEKWEDLLAEEKRRPRLDAFLRESAAETPTPLDIERL